MSTLIRVSQGLSVISTRNLTFTEGATSIALNSPLVTSTVSGVSSTYECTITAGGVQADDVRINNVSGPWTFTSLQADGFNYFSIFKSELDALVATFSSDFTDATLTYEFTINGSVVNTSVTTLDGTPTPDAINLFTTHTTLEDSYYNILSPMPQIADPDEAGKTYSVNFKARAGDENRWYMYVPTNDPILYGSDITITGTQAEVNAHILASVFDMAERDFNGQLIIDYTQSVLTGPEDVSLYPYIQEAGTLTINVTPDAGFSISTAVYDWQVDQNNLLSGIASIGDNLGTVFPANVNYRVTATLNAPAAHANGEFRTFGTGGSSVWDGINTLVIEGNKDEVNSHLSAFEWWSRGPDDAFTFSVTIERNANNEGWVQMAQDTSIEMNVGAPYTFDQDLDVVWTYDEDTFMYFNDNRNAPTEPSEAVYTTFGNFTSTLNTYTQIGMGIIVDPNDIGTHQYRLTFTHTGPVAGYQNVSLSGVNSTFTSNTLTLTGTLTQINNNLGCMTGGCPEILINNGGVITVTGTLDDLSLGQNAVSTASFTITTS